MCCFLIFLYISFVGKWNYEGNEREVIIKPVKALPFMAYNLDNYTKQSVNLREFQLCVFLWTNRGVCELPIP